MPRAEATDRAYRFREHVERRTDELAVVPYSALTDDQQDRLIEVLTPAAASVIVRIRSAPVPEPHRPPAGRDRFVTGQNSLSTFDSMPRSSS